MSVQFWSVLSSVIWLVLAVSIAIRKRDPLHIGALFALLFILNYPLKFIATGFQFAVIDSSHYGEEYQLYALVLSNVSAFLFYLPLFLFTRKTEFTSSSERQVGGKVEWLWLVTYLFFVFYTYGGDSLIRLFSSYELRELISLRGEGRVGSALAAIAAQLARVCLTMFCISLALNFDKVSKTARVFLVLVYIFVAYALLGVSGSKNLTLQPLATFILALSWVACIKGHPWSLKRLFVLGAVGLSLLFITGYLRSFPDEYTEYPEGRLVYAASQLAATFDAPDNLTLIIYRMNDLVWGDMNFQPTLFNVLYSVIPRAIWSDKPLLHANQQIMREYLHERYTDYTGEVLAPSMAGELIVSGGIVFMIPASFALGLIAMFFYNRAYSDKTNYFFLVIYIWLVLNMFNLLRSGSGIIAPLWVFCLLTFLLLKFTSLFKKNGHEKQA